MYFAEVSNYRPIDYYYLDLLYLNFCFLYVLYTKNLLVGNYKYQMIHLISYRYSGRYVTMSGFLPVLKVYCSNTLTSIVVSATWKEGI